MRYLIIVLLLNCFHLQLEAQVKHELKIPGFQILALHFHPSYELVTNNEKFGIEIGTGLDFSKAIQNVIIDSTVIGTFSETNITSEKYKKREFKSSLALKYYWHYNWNDRYFSVFTGPYIELDQIVFLEDEFIEKQTEWASMSEFRNPAFIGQKEIRPGIKSGVKMIFKNNLVLEMSAVFMLRYDELTPNNITMRRAFFYLNPSFKVGYRFGEHPYSKKPE